MPITFIDEEEKPSKISFIEEETTPSNSPGNEYQNVIGQTFNVPGAAIASAMMGTGYAKGATQPSSIPQFSEIAARGASEVASRLPRNMVAPAAFIGSSVGQLAGMAIDPRTYVNPLSLLGLGGATAAGKNVIKTAVESVIPKPATLIKKAEKLTTEILNPGKSELADAISRGNQAKSIAEAAKVIKKSDDFNKIVSDIDKSIDINFTKRNELLKSDNFNIGGEQYISSLKHEIIRQEKLGQATPAEIMQMKKVLAREQAFIIKKGGKIDRLSAQERKEYLQNQTESLLIRDAKGKNTSTEPARTRALDALRFGLKDAVEGGDTEIARLNSTYEGLKRAKRLAAEQSALIQKAVPRSLIENIINTIKNPRESTIQATLNQGKSLSKKTARIEKLMKRAGAR